MELLVLLEPKALVGHLAPSASTGPQARKAPRASQETVDELDQQEGKENRGGWGRLDPEATRALSGMKVLKALRVAREQMVQRVPVAPTVFLAWKVQLAIMAHEDHVVHLDHPGLRARRGNWDR